MLSFIKEFLVTRKNKELYGTYWPTMSRLTDIQRGEHSYFLLKREYPGNPAIWEHAIDHMERYLNKCSLKVSSYLEYDGLIPRVSYEKAKKEYLSYKVQMNEMLEILQEFAGRSEGSEWDNAFDKYVRLIARIKSFSSITEERLILIEEECRIT